MTTRPRILVVEDDRLTLQMMARGLEDRYDVSTAADGFDGIRQVKENPPDLVILDVMMPDLSGFDVCRILKAEARFADIPILFVTALDDFDSEILALGIGGIDFLTKPVNLDLLRQRVLNQIELKRSHDLLKEQHDLLARQKAELEATLARVRTLEGLIPICMYCKKIRDERNSWNQLEQYISEHTDAVFSHGLCPTCFERHMSEL